jgi:hypothetical protein
VGRWVGVEGLFLDGPVLCVRDCFSCLGGVRGWVPLSGVSLVPPFVSFFRVSDLFSSPFCFSFPFSDRLLVREGRRAFGRDRSVKVTPCWLPKALGVSQRTQRVPLGLGASVLSMTAWADSRCPKGPWRMRLGLHLGSDAAAGSCAVGGVFPEGVGLPLGSPPSPATPGASPVSAGSADLCAGSCGIPASSWVYMSLPRFVKALADVEIYERRPLPAGIAERTVISVFEDYRKDLVDPRVDCSHMLNFCKCVFK